MHVDMMWDENLNSDLTAFYAKGNVTIENGKLLKFDPLLALSKYIDINELVDLRFSKMENTIEIKNQMIFIPNMHVSSNAIDMDLSGTHTFQNIVDYHIRVLLSDVLWKKSKRNSDSQFGDIENDGTGKSSLFIRMYGPADNPKFSLDKLMIKKKIKEDLQKEKSIVKDVLKEEFKGWFKKDQEFREQQNEIPEPWETDLPQKKTPTLDKTKTDSVTKKSKLTRLKEKLSEPIETDE
jgi:AsmA-like C-terminal region